MQLNGIKSIAIFTLIFTLVVGSLNIENVNASTTFDGVTYNSTVYIVVDTFYDTPCDVDVNPALRGGRTITNLKNAFLVYYPQGYKQYKDSGKESDTLYYALCSLDNGTTAINLNTYSNTQCLVGFVSKPTFYKDSAHTQEINVPTYIGYSLEYTKDVSKYGYTDPFFYVPTFDLKVKIMYDVQPFSLIATKGQLKLDTSLCSRTQDDFINNTGFGNKVNAHGGGGGTITKATPSGYFFVKGVDGLIRSIPTSFLNPTLGIDLGDFSASVDTTLIGKYVGDTVEIDDISFDIEYEYQIHDGDNIETYSELYTYHYNYTNNVFNYETVNNNFTYNYTSTDDDIINITVNNGANIADPNYTPPTGGGGGSSITDITIPTDINDIASSGIGFLGNLAQNSGGFMSFITEIGTAIGGSTIGLLFAGVIICAIFMRVLGR